MRSGTVARWEARNLFFGQTHPAPATGPASTPVPYGNNDAPSKLPLLLFPIGTMDADEMIIEIGIAWHGS